MSSAGAIAGQLRSESWVGGAPRSGGDPCASIPGIMGWALDYIQPLKSWFDDLLGDPSAVAGFAYGWQNVEVLARQVGDQLTSDKAKLQELDGKAIRKVRERYDDLDPIVVDVAEWSGAAAAALRLASTIVTAVRQFICDFLVKLANFADALTEWSWDLKSKWEAMTKMGDAAGDLITSGQQLLDTMFTALKQLGQLLVKLQPIVDEALEKVRLILAEIVWYVPIVGGAVSDILQNAPDVEELDPDSLDSVGEKAYEDLMDRGSVTSPVDLLEQNRLIDKISGGDSTAISVQTIRRPDGSEYTLVNLPSTLDWSMLKAIMGDEEWAAVLEEYGPINDLDSNVALMTMPGLKTQYERAVLDAMRDAGVPPGADVVWSGFSQGGIMAGNLGENSPYNTIGVIANGAPMQNFNIPPHIPVLRVEHTDDIVPMLDLKDGEKLITGIGGKPIILPTPPNHDVVRMPAPTDAYDENGPISMPAHNAQTYRDTLDEWMRNNQLNNDWDFLNGEIVETYIGHTGE